MAQSWKARIERLKRTNPFIVIGSSVATLVLVILGIAGPSLQIVRDLGWLRTGDVLEEIARAFDDLASGKNDLLAIDRLVRIADKNKDERPIVSARLADFVRAKASIDSCSWCDSLRSPTYLGEHGVKATRERLKTSPAVKYAIQKFGEPPLSGNWGSTLEPKLDLRNIVLSEVPMAHRTYPSVDFDRCIFLSCDLTDVTFSDRGNLGSAVIIDGNSDGLKFHGVSLNHAVLGAVTASGIEIKNCTLVNFRILRSELTKLSINSEQIEHVDSLVCDKEGRVIAAESR